MWGRWLIRTINHIPIHDLDSFITIIKDIPDMSFIPRLLAATRETIHPLSISALMHVVSSGAMPA